MLKNSQMKCLGKYCRLYVRLLVMGLLLLYSNSYSPKYKLTNSLFQDSGNSGSQRSQGSNQAKAGSKQGYQPSYWHQA